MNYWGLCIPVLGGKAACTGEVLADLASLKYGTMPAHIATEMYQSRATKGKSDADLFDDSLCCLKPVEEIRKLFFDDEKLLRNAPRDPRDNLDPGAVQYITQLLQIWFSQWKRGSACSNWLEFFTRLVRGLSCGTVDVEGDGQTQWACVRFVKAMDKALDTIVRMHVLLDHCFKKKHASGNFLDHFETLIPGAAMQDLTDTKSSLTKYRRQHDVPAVRLH